jgi:hypothetical protein
MENRGGMITGKVLICLPELSGNLTSIVIWKQAEEVNDEFGLAKYFYSHLQETCHKNLMTLGLPALLPFQRKLCCRYLLPLKIYSLSQD